MRRADRLFQIVQHLRGGRLVTASKLADRLEVSDRTIYRDIADLQSTGVPIDGEAGVGYIMRDGYELPPLMFTRDEIVALVAGARMTRAWGGAAMTRAAEEALVKIESVLPSDKRSNFNSIEIHAPAHRMSDEDRKRIDALECAANKKTILNMTYADQNGALTERQVRPLGLWFWGGGWTFVGWCELRKDFRTFRIDRIKSFEPTGQNFRSETGKTLRDFYRKMEQETTWRRPEN